MNEHTGNDFYNIGTGKGYTILELAEIIKQVVEYSGKISFDKTKPEGTAKKIIGYFKNNYFRLEV